MDAAALAPGAPALTQAAQARLDGAAREFEALVIAQLLAPVFSSVETPGLAGGGPGEKAFSGLLHEEYAKSIAAEGGFGIAESVKGALIEMQAAQTR